jgi:dihydrofolate synthase/folylpolyglutamate synthase
MPARPSYKKAIQYLYSLEKYGIRLGLRRIKTLLKSLGNPQDRLNLIHVAGTNGKGSTCALIESVLIRAGYKVGLYTSPHLVRFNERIRINGREITDKKVAELVERIRYKSQKSEVRGQQNSKLSSPTFFEFTTAMAFLYFAEEKVDIAVIEVGLGGRLDATNVGSPIVSIITNIEKDHEAILGSRMTDIAFEKAGIIKRNGILISAEEKSAMLKVLASECRRKRAAFYRLNKDFLIDDSQKSEVRSLPLQAVSRGQKSGGRTFSFKGRRRVFKDLKTNLLGKHQLQNAACALAALEVLEEDGYDITESAVRKGLKNIFWPGRLEIVSKRPLIVLDCAHNPAGAAVLKRALQREFNYKRLFLILGIMADKDIKGIISTLAPIADTVILTRPKTERAASLEMLYKEIMDLRITNYELRMKDSNRKSKILNRKLKIMLIENVQEACRTAISMSKAGDMLCITGSIFTVGEAREALRQMQIANYRVQNVKLKKGKR